LDRQVRVDAVCSNVEIGSNFAFHGCSSKFFGRVSLFASGSGDHLSGVRLLERCRFLGGLGIGTVIGGVRTEGGSLCFGSALDENDGDSDD